MSAAPNMALVEIDPLQLDATAGRARRFAERSLREAKDIVLTTALKTFVPDRGKAGATTLWSISAELVKSYSVWGLVLTGGAIAFVVS